MSNVSTFPLSRQPASGAEAVAIDLFGELIGAFAYVRSVIADMPKNDLLLARRRIGTLDLSQLDIDGYRGLLAMIEIIGAETQERLKKEGI